MNFNAKTYTNGFVLDGQSRWVAVDNPLEALTKALKVLEKPLYFFSLAAGGVLKGRSSFFS